MAYDSIVVGTDGSDTAERAVAHAATLAVGRRRPAGGRQRLHARAGDQPPASTPTRVPEDIRFTLTDRVQAEELAERGPDPRHGGRRGQGGRAGPRRATPADVLIEAADDFDAD